MPVNVWSAFSMIKTMQRCDSNTWNYLKNCRKKKNCQRKIRQKRKLYLHSWQKDAVRMVYQVAQAVSLPIIGMGGIATAEDALEFIMAGATAVSVGTANFFNPYATVEIAEGIENFMREQHVEDIHELIGAVK